MVLGSLTWSTASEMSVEKIEGRDKKLVGVLKSPILKLFGSVII